MFFRGNGNLASRFRFYSDFVSCDSLLQFEQLFPVHGISAGCGYISLCHVGDFLLARVDTAGGDRRTACNLKTGFVERYVIADGDFRKTGDTAFPVFIVNYNISYLNFISQTYLVIGRLSVFCNIFNFDAASVFVTCNSYLIRVNILLDGFSGNEISVFISVDRSVFRDVYHIFCRLVLLCFRSNGNLTIRCRFYSDFVFRDSLLQIGNRLVSLDINLASVNAVCNGRAGSFYAESIAGCVKGNGIILVIDCFTGFFRVFV